MFDLKSGFQKSVLFGRLRFLGVYDGERGFSVKWVAWMKACV